MREAGGSGGGGRRQGSRIFLPFTIWLTSAPETVSCSSHLYLPSPRPGGSQPCLSFLVPESSNGTDARPRPRDSEGVVPGVESGFSTFYLLPGGPLI